MPSLSILTPSYNKPEYVLEAVNSVLRQTYKDFEYWLIDNSTDGKTREALRPIAKTDPRVKYLEIDFSVKDRHQSYIPAYIFNSVFAEITTPLGFYLSDDDILHPTCLELMVKYLTEHPQAEICYHTQEKIVWKNNRWVKDGQIDATVQRGLNTNDKIVDCALDGGQILWRNQVLKSLNYPYVTESIQDAPHCDGLFMQSLADKFTFYPVPSPYPLSTHRVTPKSTWQRAPKP